MTQYYCAKRNHFKTNKKVITLNNDTSKHVRGFQISHSLKKRKVDLKVFHGTRDKYMQNYAKPTFREKPMSLSYQWINDMNRLQNHLLN